MTTEHRDAAMHLLQVLLSANGHQKIVEIMNSDQVLSESGTPYAAGTEYYTLGIFGNPSATEPWMIQFGGHHLALNVTLVGGQGTLAPSLTGAQSAISEFEGKTVRPWVVRRTRHMPSSVLSTTGNATRPSLADQSVTSCLAQGVKVR